jgi:excisionase family DNA binding protein
MNAQKRLPEQQMLEDGFDRVKDAARFLGVSVGMVYSLMDSGEIPFAKFGKARRIPHRSLVEYASRNLVTRANS